MASIASHACVSNIPLEVQFPIYWGTVYTLLRELARLVWSLVFYRTTGGLAS